MVRGSWTNSQDPFKGSEHLPQTFIQDWLATWLLPASLQRPELPCSVPLATARTGGLQDRQHSHTQGITHLYLIFELLSSCWLREYFDSSCQQGASGCHRLRLAEDTYGSALNNTPAPPPPPTHQERQGRGESKHREEEGKRRLH